MNFKWAIEAWLPGFDRYFEAGPTNLSKIIKKPKVERRVEGLNRKIHAADFPFFPVVRLSGCLVAIPSVITGTTWNNYYRVVLTRRNGASSRVENAGLVGNTRINARVKSRPSRWSSVCPNDDGDSMMKRGCIRDHAHRKRLVLYVSRIAGFFLGSWSIWRARADAICAAQSRRDWRWSNETTHPDATTLDYRWTWREKYKWRTSE